MDTQTPARTSEALDRDLLERAGFRPVRVTRTEPVAEAVLALTLDSRQPFAPGAHLEVAVPAPAPAPAPGAGMAPSPAAGFEAGSPPEAPAAEPLIRHYSLCSDPTGATPWQIAVLRHEDGDGGSEWIHSHVQAGDELFVRAPRASFHFRAALPALFIAGGVGITPLRSMLTFAHGLGLDWRLLYIGRSEASMAFARELEAEFGAEHVEVWATAQRGGRPDLAAAAEEWLAAHPTAVVYTCGPTALMDAVTSGLSALPHRVEREDFDPESAEAASGAGAGTPTTVGPPFTVELADGSEVAVERNESILEAFSRAGIRSLSSCRRGTCGTCETRILCGEADHRDAVLSPEEQAEQSSMMVCVSRAAGERITLDVQR